MTGYLDNGEWTTGWYDTRTTGGEFVRRESTFRNWITADGSSGFPAEPGRYHLYVSLACPWAHRTLIFRKLKRLDEVISVSVVEPVMSDQGWAFGDGSGATADTVNGFGFLHQMYTAADARYTGRVTVPVLWDQRTRTIVSNESADIIRMLNSAFDAYTSVTTDYYPERLRSKIDEINALVYPRINNGVYRCGFAGSQAAYERAFDALFSALDQVEAMLGASRYLAGDTLTEADWRLFTTLLRFDAVYYVHFKCNLRRIADYPNLSRLLVELCHVPSIAETVNMDHIKRHYYLSHQHLNPSGIVPKGPVLDFLSDPDHPISIERNPKRVRVIFNGQVIADTTEALTLKETTLAPVLYIPREDADMSLFEPTEHSTHCPYKGDAGYFSLRVGDRVSQNAVWSYEHPFPAMMQIAGRLAFYRNRVDAIEEL